MQVRRGAVLVVVLTVSSMAWSPASATGRRAARAPLVSLSDPTVVEGTPAVFEVTLDRPSPRTVSLDYRTVDGSATAPSDYVPAEGTIILERGQTEAAVVVDVRTDDGHDASRIERFELHLSTPRGAVLGNRVATATVIDDDLPNECARDEQQAHGGADGSAVWHCVVPVAGDLGKVDGNVLVLLPATYDHVTPFPVVYLLHGGADTYRSWVDNTDVEDQANVGAIFVTPDAGSGSNAGWYSDWKDGSRKWEQYHTKVLIEWVDENFATKGSGHRGVIGVSVGGFGALSYAARSPVFDAAASLSGILDTQLYGDAQGHAFAVGNDFTVAVGDYKLVSESLGTPDERVWGPPGSREWADHNPTALAAQGAFARYSGKLWVRTGTGVRTDCAEEPRCDPRNLDGHLIERFVWETNQSFRRAAQSAGTSYDHLEYDTTHDWYYWEMRLREIVGSFVDAIA